MENETGNILEKQENFPKQTFRNRTQIYGANALLNLVIPIKHTGERLYQFTQISYAEDWQKQHWKSIKNAYQSAPYFEFYEDRFAKIYENQWENLYNFNLNALEIVFKLLKINKEFSFTKTYATQPEGEDFRKLFSAKEAKFGEFQHYYQVFSDKYGFLNDLSICDLLFNLGPESLIYLKQNTVLLKK